MEFIIHSYRTHDRKKILLQKIMQNLCIYFFDLPDKSDIFSVGIFLFHIQKSTVLPADSDGAYSLSFQKLYQAFVHFSKYHFRYFHGLLIGHPKSVDKLRFFTDFSDPFTDFFSASVHNDRFEAHQF